MPRDNRCVYMVYIFYVCCGDCVGVCGNVCCVVAVVENSVFLPWSVEVCYMRCCGCVCCMWVLGLR